MTTTMRFPYARFLDKLGQPGEPVAAEAAVHLSPRLVRWLLTASEPKAWNIAATSLATLLHARKATLQAAFDTTMAADELRRYQKYAKPGKPSAHIVQLRQKQAAARQASSISRQSLIKAAAAFVRETEIDVPERVALDEFIIQWIDANIPKDEGTTTPP
ncbi:hypothetical protein [Dyella japonica]|uniref:Uncharacterized protein n=1 Tax=Dyella japonica TaxID=231455 RepID=A0ABV2JYT6_9GAMM